MGCTEKNYAAPLYACRMCGSLVLLCLVEWLALVPPTTAMYLKHCLVRGVGFVAPSNRNFLLSRASSRCLSRLEVSVRSASVDRLRHVLGIDASSPSPLRGKLDFISTSILSVQNSDPFNPALSSSLTRTGAMCSSSRLGPKPVANMLKGWAGPLLKQLGPPKSSLRGALQVTPSRLEHWPHVPITSSPMEGAQLFPDAYENEHPHRNRVRRPVASLPDRAREDWDPYEDDSVRRRPRLPNVENPPLPGTERPLVWPMGETVYKLTINHQTFGTRQFLAGRNEDLGTVFAREAFPYPNVCRSGNCGTCMVLCDSGTFFHVANPTAMERMVAPKFRNGHGHMLLCVAHLTSDATIRMPWKNSGILTCESEFVPQDDGGDQW
eukprot:GHVN01039123.1.p1 GENE.GHVN01039123.1~~GHVN01039123.1.p1  ORF type:complete len:380 (+),score=20.78 GHVN01039123.1:199-1338(+)